MGRLERDCGRAAGAAAAEAVERSPVSVWGRLAHALPARPGGTSAGCGDAGGALLLAGLLVEAGDDEAALNQLAVAVHGGMGAVEWMPACQAFEELRSHGVGALRLHRVGVS